MIVMILVGLLIPPVLFGQTIRNKELCFDADSKANTLVIKDSRTKRTWTADFTKCVSDAVITKWGPITQPTFAAFNITNVVRLDDHHMKMSVKEAQTGKAYAMIVTLDGQNVSFEVLRDNIAAPCVAVGLPPMFMAYIKAG